MKSYRNILLESGIEFNELDIIKHLYHDEYSIPLDPELGNRREYMFFCQIDEKTLLVTDPYHIRRNCKCYSFNYMIKKKMSLEEFENWCKTIETRKILEKY